MKVDLSDGQSAILREPEQLTNGQRRPLIAARNAARPHLEPSVVRAIQDAVVEKDDQRRDDLLQVANLGDISDELIVSAGEATIIALVESWTLEMPVPSEDPTSIDKLLAHDYDRLMVAAGTLIPRIEWSGDPKAGPRGTPKGRSSAPPKRP